MINLFLALNSIFLVFCRICPIAVFSADYGETNLHKELKMSETQFGDFKEESLLDLNFKNKYTLYFNDSICYVVDCETKDKVYFSKEFVYPYKDNEDYHLFNDSKETDIHFLCSDGQFVWEPENRDNRIGIDECFNGVTDFVEFAQNISSVPSYAHKINNYNYYLKLGGRHGRNDCNICTLVAIQMICSYYDTFINDDYVPEKWDYLSYDYVTNTSSWENWAHSPGAGSKISPLEDFRMCQYLLNYAISYVSSGITNYGLTFSGQRNVLNHYLGEQLVAYSLTTSEGNLEDCLNQRTKTVIKNSIDNNRPVIANGRHHSVVAFAYDDDYVYVHTGYGRCSKVVWETYTDWDITYSPTAICINASPVHTHSNNYYSTYDNHFYCSCGQQICGNDINFNLLPLSSSPNAGSINYNSNFTASLFYSNLYKDYYDRLVLEGDGQIFISLTNPVSGVMIDCFSNFTHGSLPIYQIDFLGYGENLIYSYDARSYTNLFYYYTVNTNIALNCPPTTRYIRIKVEKNNASSAKLTIKKIVLGIC